MDPNVCPVCTLYLREGITLHNHLNTHPKDQVIEALVRCASLGVPGSVRNETSDSVQDPITATQPSIETSTTPVHHFTSPLQTIASVPTSASVPVSSPYGIPGSITLPNAIPSTNAITTTNQNSTPIAPLQPFTIGLGSSGNQYASTFAYQQFCGGGDGAFGAGPLLLTMSPQQQYAAYSSSSSSSSSNSVLQMVFNPYSVDQVIGSQPYPTSGLIAGIGIGPTLQTCQQVQTNVLQQVVTASPIVAAAIPQVPVEDKERGTDDNKNQVLSQPEEVITDEVREQIEPMQRERTGGLDLSHLPRDLTIHQNTIPSSSGQFAMKSGSLPLGFGPSQQRVNRRGRPRTKSLTKAPNPKRQQSHSSTNRNIVPSLPGSTILLPVTDKSGPKRMLNKLQNPKQLSIPEQINRVFEENHGVMDGPFVGSSQHPEKPIFEKQRKHFTTKHQESVEIVDNCAEASHNGQPKRVVISPMNEVVDEVKDGDNWNDFSLFPQNGGTVDTDQGTVHSAQQGMNHDDQDDDHFQSDCCFENEEMDGPLEDPLKNADSKNSEDMEIIVLNQWDNARNKDNSKNPPTVADVVGVIHESRDTNRAVEHGKESQVEYNGEQKDYENNQVQNSECWVPTSEAVAMTDEVKDQNFGGHSLETNDVMGVEQRDNVTVEYSQDCRPCGSEESRPNLSECRPVAAGDECLEGTSNIHPGGASLNPAQGDTENALPAPPSPVNIFQIDGMNIILSSRLIEQTDKMRERLGIFEGLGPMAGSYGDISIPEGILEEEGLVVSDIIADEAMPPRGELSGQEGMGSGSNCSDGGPIEDPLPKTEGSTVWTSGGFSLFPASARQGGAQCDLLPGGEAWSPVEGFKARQEPAVPSVMPETVPKKKPRAKKSATAGSASKATADSATKTKAKRLYHCWTCLEVFNCPKERRVHQREKHGGEKAMGAATPADGSLVPPAQGDGQQPSLVAGPEVGVPLVKSEVREAKMEPKDPADVDVNESKVSTDLVDSKEAGQAAAAKLTHPCSDCDRSFPSVRSLTAHRRAAHRDSRFKCPTCAEKFLNSADFTNHVRTVHPLECSMCGKQFCRQQSLRLHLKRHLSVRPYKCTQCDKAFVTNQKMEEHLNSHTGRTPFQCPLCPRAFRRHSNLIQHRKHHHLKVKRKVRDFFCHCGAVFHSVKKLEWHKETHEDKPKACPHCSDRFVHRAGLTRHIRQAHDRRYVPLGAREDVNVECPVCSAVYLKSSLHIHMRVHSGERPFSCGICGKGFATKWNLQLHRWVHASPHSKPFKCATCKAAYHRRVDFIAHVRSHRKVRPYVCNTCGRRFMRKYNCVRHSREHETGKAFECTICQKRFHRRYYLKEHLRIHTGLRPYVCHVCGKASGTKSNMNKHVRIHHAREPVNTEG
ncbi:uncharacterized protein LOC124164095 [Ischnura elegans]|uniref:uncharacterized protein LOC124164095 n=1 Tax=Ischnura elegans TaxID=197161 RepID=UPI001ED87B99|nr:uncharacterized protein LOC124164095 [Ischnura elegans]